MATLEEALYGLNFTPAEDPYGIAATQVGQLGPKLINPYGSTGQAVGIGLGTILLQSLLGYQARQESARSTLELNTLANQMQELTTPKARTEFITGVEDPIYQSRLSTLASALTAQERARKAKAAETLLGLETGAQFQMSDLGKSLADEMNRRKAEGELAALRTEGDFLQSEEGKKYLEGLRQKSLAQAAGVSDRQRRQNEAMLDRMQKADELNKENKIFTKTLDLNNPEVPATVRAETGEAFAVANAAKRLAARIKNKIDTFAELKAARTFSSAGDGLGEEIADLNDLVIRVRTGAAASLFETNNVDKILMGSFEAGPETAVSLLNQFANRSYLLGSDRLSAGTKSPSQLAAEARKAAESNTMLNLLPQTSVTEPGEDEIIAGSAGPAVTPTSVTIAPEELAKVRAALADRAVPDAIKEKMRDRLRQYGLKE